MGDTVAVNDDKTAPEDDGEMATDQQKEQPEEDSINLMLGEEDAMFDEEKDKLMGRRLPRKRPIPSHLPGRRLHLSWLLSLPKTRSTWGRKGRPKTQPCLTTTPCWSTLMSRSQSVLRGPERGRRPRTKTA